MQPQDNPFAMQAGTTAGPQPAPHVRRHGAAEHGYSGGYGNMGDTPPRSPQRSPAGSPRGSRRSRGNEEDGDEPPARRDRSRDQRPPREDRRDSPPVLPAEWGGQTLRLERMLQECMGEITKLNGLVADMQARMSGDHNCLNAMESALPERVYRCEERQANQIQILNGFARTAAEQIATLQHRMNHLEQAPPNAPTFGTSSSNAPAFGGGRRRSTCTITCNPAISHWIPNF